MILSAILILDTWLVPNAGDGGELISLKSARWLQEGRTLLTIDSSGEIHIFSKQG